MVASDTSSSSKPQVCYSNPYVERNRVGRPPHYIVEGVWYWSSSNHFRTGPPSIIFLDAPESTRSFGQFVPFLFFLQPTISAIEITKATNSRRNGIIEDGGVIVSRIVSRVVSVWSFWLWSFAGREQGGLDLSS